MTLNDMDEYNDMMQNTFNSIKRLQKEQTKHNMIRKLQGMQVNDGHFHDTMVNKF